MVESKESYLEMVENTKEMKKLENLTPMTGTGNS